MYYSILGAIFFVTIVVTSAFPTNDNNEENVLARFYPDFVQLYRPATLKSYVDPEQTIERYQFFFTEHEHLTIPFESLTMVNTHVIDRTITYHSLPNFEVNGTRYIYRRSSKENETMEIELVNVKELLFREVNRPDRYFHLSSFRHLEYPNQVPIMPYYEVTFICNSSFSTDTPKQPPLLSYIDRSFHYTPRYFIDLPLSDTGKPAQMIAYADIRNNGDKTIVLKGVEIIAEDIIVNPKPIEYLRTGVLYRLNTGAILSVSRPISNKIHIFTEEGTGAYVYQLPMPTPVTFPPCSIKTLQFLTPNITVKPYTTYSSVFLPYAVSGKLYKSYNLTSHEIFLPAGRLVFYEQGRFVDQINLPDLLMNDTYPMIFGYDADVNYRREVEVLEGDTDSDTIIYQVKYFFDNTNISRDIRVSFSESFSLFKYYQVQNLSTPEDNFVTQNQCLRGSIYLPRHGEEKVLSYKLIIYKEKPTTDTDEQ